MSACLVVSAQAKESVFINTAELFEKSKMGSAFKREAVGMQKEIQELALSEQSKVTDFEKSFEEARKTETDNKALEAKASDLEAKRRRAQFNVEEKNREFTAKLKTEEQKLQKTIMDEVETLATAEGWASVSDSTGCLFVSKELNKTDKVVEVLNKKHDAQVAKAALGA
jgi:Skp family chaperone for outer membrane proteins